MLLQKCKNFFARSWRKIQNPKNNLIILSVFFVIFMVFMILHLINSKKHFLDIPNELFICLLLIDTFVIFYVSLPYFKNYYKLIKGSYGMNLLIALGSHISYFYSLAMFILHWINNEKLSMEFLEVPVSLLFFINLGHYLESKLSKSNAMGIKDFLKLQNFKSLRLNSDGTTTTLPTSKLQINDLVIVAKGQRVPIDGIVHEGFSTLDTSFITGESLPNSVEKDAPVFSGSLNLENQIVIKVTKQLKDSTIQRIISKLENILETKTKIQLISEKIVRFFIPTIILIAIITFISWTVLLYNYGPSILPSFYNGPSYDEQGKFGIAIWITVSVIVVSCPCAFGIASPSIIYAASFLALKNKILFASSKVYEKLNKVKYIVFDKTGTLTYGKPSITQYFGDSSYLKYAASLAVKSSHPLSKAIYEYVNKVEITFDSFVDQPGIGLKAILGEDEYVISSFEKLTSQGFVNQTEFDPNTSIATNVVIAKNKIIYGVFEIMDEIKTDAIDIIQLFKKNNIEVIVASGDNERNVKYVANKLGIEKYYSQVSPEQKLEIIESLKEKGITIFVGDGLNDVLAIAKADLGIAYNSGSDLVNNFADISLMDVSLNAVYKSIFITKKSLKAIKINFFWAIIFNLMVLPLSMISFIMPWFGAVLMVSSSIVLTIHTIMFKKINQNKLQKMSKPTK